ncbi:MAG TPA: hypothetical protein VMU03_02535, partial [Gammaproteobacteria bacterium]|nr:hypothetical protein [Gammaproteobacteria bacterium]
MQRWRQRLAVVLSVAVLAAAGCTQSGHGPTGAAGAPASSRAERVAPGDWPAYNRTLAGDRFSPLEEIDRGNVA